MSHGHLFFVPLRTCDEEHNDKLPVCSGVEDFSEVLIISGRK